jgi:hypothetical protein
MSIEGDPPFAEREDRFPGTADAANDPESADSNWKKINLLSLGTSSIPPARFRRTNHVHR